jgi:DNA helicase-2/ATP-dependent DNA helicase PcrA
VAEQLQSRFLHVLVDEYQDVNRLQAIITDAMALGHGSLTVVGDDDQSIYAFRGAWPDAMLRFPERHPGAAIYRIQSNYRSIPQVLRLANASIRRNRRRHEKTLRPVRPPGELPVVVSVEDVYQQAAFVAQRVLELHEQEGIPLSGMAVLYRAHSHSLELQVELTRRQIPFTVRAGLRFFEQAHIKDALAHLRWLVNPVDELAGMRVLRLQPGVGTATASRVLEHLSHRPPPRLSEGLRAALSASAVAGRGRGRIKGLVPLFERLEARNAPGPALRAVSDGSYREIAIARYANADTRLEDLAQLADFADQYEECAGFLQEISLMAGVAAEGFQPGDLPDDSLTLSTVHQAKGLEWDAVFLLWLCEGHFPSAMALRDPEGDEEERRLFHVAATRARDLLTLIHPNLAEQGNRGRIISRPSRFLVELEEDGAQARAAGDEALLFERWRVEEAYQDEGGGNGGDEAGNEVGNETGNEAGYRSALPGRGAEDDDVIPF